MAVVLIEGFDHMGTITKLGFKGWTFANTKNSFSTSPTTGIDTGRLTKSSLLITSGTNGTVNSDTIESATKVLPSTYTTAIIGCAVKPGNQGVTGGPYDILQLSAGGTATARIMYKPSTGIFSIQNSSGTTIATGTTSVAAGSWCYVEMKIVINGASGSVTFNLNGASEIAVTTGNFGSSAIDRVVCCASSPFGSTPAQNVNFDDMYVADTTGASPRNTFLGICAVETLMPSADGTSSAWTPNSGSAHFSRVNEISGTYPDDDTSYVYTSGVGNRDTYACDDLGFLTGTIFGLQVGIYARKDDVSSRVLAPVIRQGGTNYDGTSQPALSTTYTWNGQIYNQDPTASDWTIVNVDADEFGVKLVS